jgi:AI-2 transport protein TqsA
VDTHKINTGLLFTIALVSVGLVLRLAASIFIPFVIAILLYFILAPMVNSLEKMHVPRYLSVITVLLIVLAVSSLLGLIVYTSVQSLIREFPAYQRRFFEILSEIIERFELPPDVLEQFDLIGTVRLFLLTLSGNFMTFLSGLVVVLIYLLFLLLEKPYMKNKVTQALQEHNTRKITIVFAHITTQIGRYLRVKLFVSFLTGCVVYMGFMIIGVEFAFIWGFLTLLFNFIPSIGSIVIGVTSSLFVIIQFVPDWNPIVAALLIMGLSQFFIGNVLDPKLLGDSLNVSPVVILFSLLFWGWLWGVIGMFLAVPLTVALKITFENIPGLEPLSVLMGTGNNKTHQRKRRQPQHNRKDIQVDAQ